MLENQKRPFYLNVLKLMSGTTLAQAIPILVSPILTRIYTPEDFGLLAVYLMLTSVLSVIATLRMELTILLPKENEEAKNLVYTSILLSFAISSIIFGIIFFTKSYISDLLSEPKIESWLLLLPISIFIFGCYQTLNYWLNRNEHYWQMSKNRVIQGLTKSSSELTIGSLGFTSVGLISSYIIGWALALVSIFRDTRLRITIPKIETLKFLLKKYKDYPLYSTPTAILDNGSVQAPVLFLSYAFSSSTVGFYSLAMRIVSAPLTLISTSIGQVYFQKISILAQEDQSKLINEVWGTLFKLFVLSAVIFVPLHLLGELVFTVVFGESWAIAGRFVEILSIGLAVKFMVSPLSSIFSVTNNIKLGSVWKVQYFIFTTSILLFATKFDPILFIWLLAIHEVVQYLVYLAFIIYSSKNYKDW